MNFNYYVVYDFETGGADPNTCQPTELSAVAVDGRKLTIHKDEVFSSLIKPIFDDDEAKGQGLQPVQQKALDVTNIKREDLKKAPEIKLVWKQFTDWVGQYNKKKNMWTAPVRTGYNSYRFDDLILDRICRPAKTLSMYDGYQDEDKEIVTVQGYGLGPWDDDRGEQRLFHPRDRVDVMNMFVYPWLFENKSEIKSYSLDSMRDFLGLDKTGAHRAEKDVFDTAELLVRFLKRVRYFEPKINWQPVKK